jgi:nucleotide-binding universal stress UspA family protein
MVVLVHSRQSPVTTDLVLREAVDAWEDARVRQEADYLDDLARRIGRDLGIAVRHQLLAGDVVPALEREVRVHDVDLVVMTTHGRAGLARAWLGSVADALVRNLEVPVLLVRPDDGPPDRLDGGGYRHVLIALDGSERAERAIEPALALAPLADTRITLIRTAAPPAAITSPFIPHAARFTHEEMEQSRATAEEYLAATAASLQDRGRDVHTAAAVDYHAARAIIRFADENDVDLIAMGTHGRSPVTRLVLGSTSDKVVRSASVPVLVC